ncbi:MAG: anaerobic carbon-monoxide dehydrogenase catalytic subunit [Acidobacteria bacterium]|nr:anaerobic carbon-monoxide dehydrogenase catalytic subunit [Acidobacteriota bacterium]
MTQKSVDRATQEMIQIAADQNLEITWDRWEKQQPQCGFGQLGVCCRICNMGPCRIDPFGGEPRRGACGADADTFVARHLSRMIAAGTSAHSDHGRDVVHTLHLAAEGKGGYVIKDPLKLRRLAVEFGIKVDGQSDAEVARAVAGFAGKMFGQQEGELPLISRAPAKRQELWRKLGIVPRGIDREVVEVMHRSTMGVDNDYKNILMHGMRAALADGWGGSMIATDIQDVLFDSPQPIRSKVNLGVLRKDAINIIVHGHEPVLSEMLVAASRDKDLLAMADGQGAAGINVAGICCTANEILMRHGVPVAGNFLQQELAIITGAVDLMVVDVQCVMPSVASLTGCFHTKLVTTSKKAKMPNVEHVEFQEESAFETAKEIVARAVESYSRRDPRKVNIPDSRSDMIAGFTTESVFQFLGGRFRGTYRPLNDAVIDGRLRGAVGIVGCNNPNMMHDYAHIALTRELLKNDVLVVSTGCAAIADAKCSLLRPEAAYESAGPGLREICETVGIPPVLHVGSCVDNSRILTTLIEIVSEGGLGDDFSKLPVAGSAPEWMSEKAVAIGFYFVASGVLTHFGTPHPVLGSPNVHRYITKDLEEIVGGRFFFESDPVKTAATIIEHLDRKRADLKLAPPMYTPSKSFQGVTVKA